MMCGLLLAAGAAMAEDLVILTTNDTHSNIDTDVSGAGGVLPRKAIIDSVRKAEKNVILVDAGDIVQGTLYFKYFKGDVEYPLFNMMDYDIRILGNHEFDNGIDELARYWKNVKGDRLSANYDFSDTPARGIFMPSVIKKVDGHKVGFLGLNVDPKSLISEENYNGMKFKDIISTANAEAARLRKKGCDLVVAVTHIGYGPEPGRESDLDLARQSRDIDIIIGGHSHSFVDPSTPDKTPYRIVNAEGRPVLVTQTGKYGRNVGCIKIDLDHLADRDYGYEYIPVTDRFPHEAYDNKIEAFLAPYKHVVDSVNSVVVGHSLQNLSNRRESGPFANWAGDFGQWYGRNVADSLRMSDPAFPDVDLAIMNVGGIRQPMPEGPVTEGQILSTFPFSNRLRLISIKGSDLVETMKIVAPRGGEAVSEAVRVVTDGKGNVLRVVVNGEEVDPERDYTVCTIDYIAEGNDDMIPMKRHRELWRDSEEVSVRILEYVRHLESLGLGINPDPTRRFVRDVRLPAGEVPES